MNNRAFESATQWIDALKKQEVGVVELCDFYISRIEQHDTALNAVVVRDFDRARDAARAIEQQPMNQRGVLAGLPMTIKESYDVEGLPTTWGHPELANRPAKHDSAVVERYRQAGAIFLGKTNVPLALADFQSYNEVYGVTNNPWDVSRSPGGSSGGAAAAIAAGLTVLETGSDIGGSIRNPAHYCGIYGHKPTFGIVPQQGHALPGQLSDTDLVVCGPLARSADDLALAMSIIAAPPTLDAAGWQLNLPAPGKKQLKDFRVAVWASDDICPVDDAISSAIEETARQLEDAGATVSRTARPKIDPVQSHRVYMTLLHSVLGASAGAATLRRTRQIADQLDSNDHSDAALMTRAMIADHRHWLGADNVREKMRYQWREFFTDWDVLLCPQMSTVANPHDHQRLADRTIAVNGETQPYMQQIFWSGLATVGHLPSTVFPTGLKVSTDAVELPVGIQAIGSEYNDYLTIEFSRLLSEIMGGYLPPATFE